MTTTKPTTTLVEEFRDYAWFGAGSGKIHKILKHPDFTPAGDQCRYFFLFCNYASPETNAIVNASDIATWLSAAREFERMALRPTIPPRNPRFEAVHAVKWAGSVIRAGYKIQEKFPGHPVINWLQCPEAEGIWKGPDGLLVELYRKLGIMEKRTLIDTAIHPVTYSESDALLYIMFRVYAAAHCKQGSAAWKIAHEEVGKDTNHGTLYSVPKNKWENLFSKLKNAPHA